MSLQMPNHYTIYFWPIQSGSWLYFLHPRFWKKQWLSFLVLPLPPLLTLLASHPVYLDDQFLLLTEILAWVGVEIFLELRMKRFQHEEPELVQPGRSELMRGIILTHMTSKT